MEIKKFKPKTSFEEAFVKLTSNFAPLYEVIDDHIEDIKELTEKRFKKGKDHVLFEELGLLVKGQKMLFQMSEDHAKFIYAIREIVSEYGEAIEKLSKQVEYLAENMPDKKDSKNFQHQVMDTRMQLDSVKTKMQRIMDDLQEVRKDVEPVAKYKDLFEEFVKKMRARMNEGKNDE